jgi:hypothetical protein
MRRIPFSSIASLATASFLLLSSCDKRGDPVAPQSSGQPTADPVFTASSGSVSTLLGRGHFGDILNVQRQTGAWNFKADGSPLDVAVQSIVFQPGGQSGWHMHPGPVFILVAEGTMTFYESDDPLCRPIVRTAGHGYLDVGDHAHIARNESQLPATNIVTYFAPPNAALRIDRPNPGNCPF